MKKLNNKDIEIAVEIDGVYAQGFGMLAQKVMLEKELPLQSKAIYAYLASYAGSGKIYPKRSTILRDLNMNKDTYYKYLNRLVEKSYISISKAKGFLNKNVYTICSNPNAIGCPPSASAEHHTLSLDNIYSYGYGNMPKLIMCDTRLSVKARGMIALFYSLAQSSNTVFPTRDYTMEILGISKQTYYNTLNELIAYGYISVIKRKGKNGKFCVNNYILNTNPTVIEKQQKESNKPCPKFSDNVKNAIKSTLSPCPKKQDNENNRVLKSRTLPCPNSSDNTVSQNFGHYNNTIYNNTINNSKSYHNLIIDRINLTVPFTTDNDKIVESIKELTDYNAYQSYVAYENDIYSRLYCKAVDLLCDMATNNTSQTYNKTTVSQRTLIYSINNCITKHGIAKANSLCDLISDTLLNYEEASKEYEIRNYSNYLKTLLFDNITNFAFNLAKFDL